VSFVILGAYAPAYDPETGDAGAASLPLLLVVATPAASGSAGAASLPLLFSLAVPVEPEPDPTPDVDAVDWRDHSPDLLLTWGDADPDGFILEVPAADDALSWVDHDPTLLVFAEPSLTAVDWIDHVPTTAESDD
jgi:hypothetical protein